MSELAPSVRVGSKWLHNPPGAEEFLSWFKTTVRIHEDLKHEDYVDGIVLISQKEKVQETHLDSNGDHQLIDVERIVYRPYPQVDTRIAYFWDWCAAEKVRGTIEILSPRTQSQNLPAGFTATRFFSGDTPVDFVSAKCRVRAYEDQETGISRGRCVLSPADATKVVKVHSRYGVDENALMKAETGAQGRALGFAGMLIIPGAGLSTAEDMQEFTDSTPVRPQAQLPANTPAQDSVPEQPRTLSERIDWLQLNEPDKFYALREWAEQRNISLTHDAEAHSRVLDKRLRDLGA